jgi:hypothetical protein
MALTAGARRPISIRSTGRVNVNLFGFTIPLSKVNRL